MSGRNAIGGTLDRARHFARQSRDGADARSRIRRSGFALGRVADFAVSRSH